MLKFCLKLVFWSKINFGQVPTRAERSRVNKAMEAKGLIARDEKSNFCSDICNDPLTFKNYVNKEVNITTENNSVQNGIVYTVDPVSESVVLLQPQTAGNFILKVIVGSAVKNIEIVMDSETVIPELFTAAPIKHSHSAIMKRKLAVKELLLSNRFPVTEKDDVLYIEDVVSIEPPYGPEHCICWNTIVLRKLQDLLSGCEK